MKRVVSLGLAAVMAVSLTACGGGSETPETPETSAADAATTAASGEETTAADAQEPTEGGEESAAAPTGEGGSFKVGVIGPLTGDAAAYGLAVQHGAEIAAEEINAAGGINGMTVELGGVKGWFLSVMKPLCFWKRTAHENT